MPGVASRLAAVALLSPLAASAGVPHLVRDINTTFTAVSSSPGDFIDQGSWSFFGARANGAPIDAYATDGSLTGTVRLALLGGTGVQTLRADGFTYFFGIGANLAGPARLWKTDGTAAGTTLVVDALDGGNLLASLGDVVLFSTNGAGGREVWRTDGTTAGTAKIADESSGLPWFSSFVVVGGKAYALAMNPDDSTVEPWVSDGTAAGTRSLGELPSAAAEIITLSRVVAVGRYVLFVAPTTDRGHELWRIDTSNDTVARITDIVPGPGDGANVQGLTSLANGQAVFLSEGAVTIWHTDGTPAGTGASTGAGTLSVRENVFFGPTTTGRLAFFADDGVNGLQAWSTNGTSTARLSSGYTGSFSATAAGALFYWAGVDSGAVAVWRSDGTLSGTRKIAALPPFRDSVEIAGAGTTAYIRGSVSPPASTTDIQVVKYDAAADTVTPLRNYTLASNVAANPERVFAVARDRLYFDSGDDVTGRELWISDGTATGTRLVRNIAEELRNHPSDPSSFVAFKGKLYFAADDGIHGRELWMSDGTSAGTSQVYDLNPGQPSGSPSYAFTSADRLFFFAITPGNLEQLWVSDGTSNGTAPLATLYPITRTWGECGPRAVELNGNLYFAAGSAADGMELWRTDGTSAGTQRVADIVPGLSASNPCGLAVHTGRLYFTADVFPASGRELWHFDSATASAELVTDLEAGSSSSATANLVSYGGYLYFTTTAGSLQRLWRSDGTAAGTVPVAELAPTDMRAVAAMRVVNGKLVLLVQRVGSLFELWLSDGTAAGTAAVPDLLTRGFMHVSGGLAYLQAVGATAPGDLEPWITDGTVAGTRLLHNVDPSSSSEPLAFADFAGITVFQALIRNPSHELWRTNGTTASTTLIGSIGPAGTDIVSPTQLGAGQTFFYTSDDGNSAAELFGVTNDAPAAAADAASATSGVAATIAVLANDSDGDGTLAPGTVRIESTPANGSATVTTAGTISYTPNATFAGTDSFSYSVADHQGARSATAVVQVTVTAGFVVGVPPTPPAQGGGGGGGGGALDFAALLLLGLLASTRRTKHRLLS